MAGEVIVFWQYTEIEFLVEDDKPTYDISMTTVCIWRWLNGHQQFQMMGKEF